MPKGAEFYHLAPRAYNEAMITVYDVNYKESVLMGYRWYEAKGIEPLYPFGYGLSYTTFEITKPKAPKSFDASKPLKVSVELKNTGSKDGAETVQVYVTEKNPTVLRPKKELKSIKKVALKAGEKQKVEFELSKKDFAFWNDQTHEWTVNSGTFVISLGTSSANIAQTLEIEVK
jgi:beta-glucosidase